ncbi:MAG: Fic family protein [Candidatus Bathyarchaeia archaeon]
MINLTMMDIDSLYRTARVIRFIRESNAIENIHREPTKAEIKEYNRFLKLKKITVHQLKKFVKVIEPKVVIRDEEGLDVRIGGKLAPLGHAEIPYKLKAILDKMELVGAYSTHIAYEHLHPFTDGNGRSGRILWLWQQKKIPELSFLHSWYYQTLQHSRNIANGI